MLSNFHFPQLSSHLAKMTPALLLLLGILSTCALAALQPPPDPYLGDIETNYTYERACHHYAVDQSSRIYESGSVRFRMLDVYYHKCLSTIWPECEVVKTTEQFPRFDSHIAFKRNDIIAVDSHSTPTRTAPKRGFFVQDLLARGRCCIIFWNPHEPPTNKSIFYKLKLHNLDALLRARTRYIASATSKYRNLGALRTDKLYLQGGRYHQHNVAIMTFDLLALFIKDCLAKIRSLGGLYRLSIGILDDIQTCLTRYKLHLGAVTPHVARRANPSERIQLLYPFYTPVDPHFILAIHYTSRRMLPTREPCDLTGRTFIAAAFDEDGNTVDATSGKIASFLIISFSSIKIT